jgi:hypothetical protein
MARRIRGWLALSGSQRASLVAMMIALPSIAVALRLFDYQSTRQWLERHSLRAGSRSAGAGDFAAAQDLANLASIAGRHGAIKATCLRQSLLVYWLLRRRGLNPDIKLGVRKHDGIFDAHAWVELDGVALAQSDPVHQPFEFKQESGSGAQPHSRT